MTQLTRKEITELRARAIYSQYPRITDEGRLVSYEEARERSLSNGNLAYACAQATIEADEKAGVLMLVEDEPLRVLVACEESQMVTKALRDKGIEAYSCDILDCSGDYPEWHIKRDVAEILNDNWDMIIAHPPCTYLCNSGVRWLHTEEGRWKKLQEAIEFFNKIKNANCKYIAIENPIPHKYAKIGQYSQIIQPWQFGHGETKATCLWLKNLPLLSPTKIVDGRDARVHEMAPGKNRSKERSKTLSGIAEAMAEQWGGFLLNIQRANTPVYQCKKEVKNILGMTQSEEDELRRQMNQNSDLTLKDD